MSKVECVDAELNQRSQCSHRLASLGIKCKMYTTNSLEFQTRRDPVRLSVQNKSGVEVLLYYRSFIHACASLRLLSIVYIYYNSKR
jgi:hypothetical protein